MFLSLSFTFFFLFYLSPSLSSTSELELLMQIKASLDPENRFLTSWTADKDPCGGSFEGVACNGQGKVANISLQGKGLAGKIPAEIGGLKGLTGLYLHFNALNGEIPEEIAALSELTDLYLNVNNLSGEIPPEIGKISSLEVLQLCYNKLTGGIPNQLGYLNKLNVLALQNNQLIGTIPASLGNLWKLTRLDLSFNGLFGPIPVGLASSPTLEVLDIRNNTFSGNVPPALKRLNGGFRYANNPGLCGVGFLDLQDCTALSQLRGHKPEPFIPKSLPARDMPESVSPRSTCSNASCSNSSKSPQIAVICGLTGVIIAFMVTGIFALSWYRRQKQKLGNSCDALDSRLSTNGVNEVRKKSASPLISLEYSNGWDPLAKGKTGNGLSQELFESFMLNLEDVERATRCFSEVNLLSKGSFSAIYKGILRDGSIVAVKCIAKTSCKSDETEFLKGLKILTSLKHENLVRLRGFCCSKGRGECFLVYDFFENGNLLQYLDVKDGEKVLDWPTRTSIISGVAEGIVYLHQSKGKKRAILHQNISAEKVLLDQRYKPLLEDSGLHKLLADDIVFSTLKASAAMGYLAPEYTTTGRFSERSDVYAFGILVLQILSGQRIITQSIRQAAESHKFEDFVDTKLKEKFSKPEAAKLGSIAFLCTHECPYQRPSMETVIQELSSCFGSSVLETSAESFK